MGNWCHRGYNCKKRGVITTLLVTDGFLPAHGEHFRGFSGAWEKAWHLWATRNVVMTDPLARDMVPD